MRRSTKNLIISFLILITIIISSCTTYANTQIIPNQSFVVTIDGKKVNFNDNLGYPLLLSTERTFVPIRIISENLGFGVNWDNEAKKVTINKDDTNIEITINEAKALVNGKEIYIDTKDGKPVLESKAFLYKDRTYLPLRFISEAFGAKVDYERKNGTHYITINTKANGEVSENFIEPEFNIIQYDSSGPDGVFFEIIVDNYKEYLGTDAKFSTVKTSHKHYDHYLSPDIFVKGKWNEMNKENWYANRVPCKDSIYFTIYEFLKTENQLDIETKKVQSLPKIGEIMKVRVTLTMNGESKDYDLEIPFKGRKGEDLW
jgi:hypothetical protein